MSTIKISVDVKDSLKEFGEGASIDKALVKLLDASDKPHKEDMKVNSKQINVFISEDTLGRLKEYKLCNSETHTETILRLLNELGS